MICLKRVGEPKMQKSMRAAKTLCELSEWSLTNLEVQKILYLANRSYLGRTGNQLVDHPFEAWDYGPVLPPVYHECKMYGNKPVKGGFYSYQSLSEGPEKEAILSAYEALKNKTGAELVALTHQPGGAWSRVYSPGTKKQTISVNLIGEEYDALERLS